MSSAYDTFVLFQQLPKELRENVWRLCLPIRVCEIDTPTSDYMYGNQEAPCTLFDTTIHNSLPPLVTQVCRESRSVAFKEGRKAARSPSVPSADFTKWKADNLLSWTNGWLDRISGIVHMNWTPIHNTDWGMEYEALAPVNYLLEAAISRSAGRASFIADWWTDFHWETPPRYVGEFNSEDDNYDRALRHGPGKEEQSMIAAFSQLSACLVVLQIVVVHTDTKIAAACGLFGPLGDAPVQVISMANEIDIDAYFHLARDCENQSPVSIRQDLTRRTLAQAKNRLRYAVVDWLGTEEMLSVMEPAIMFRLCTKMCNHPEKRSLHTVRLLGLSQ